MFKFDVLELNDGLEIVKIDDKTFYNTDTKLRLNSWVKEKPRKEDMFPNFKSAFNIGEKTRKFDSDSFGYLVTNGNNVENNTSNCYIIDGPPNNNKAGTVIYESNFFKSMIVLTVRKLITSDWINSKDEYLVPNERNGQFEQFKYDSLVYSLFNSSNGMVSFRQVEYKDRLWDIKNEFFWMSKDRMKELANKNDYYTLYNDARTSDDRHVYKLLFGEERIYDKLSPDARAVLDKATELVEKSMELRRVMANDEYYHLDSWDAGYAQLKLIWKDYFQEDFKEFRQLYKNLEDRMRPLVYELGFLIK
jgi:hypothetical protein